MTDTHWPDYYAVTVDRPAWGTVVDAAERFATGGTHGSSGADGLGGPGRPDGPARLAVDLGCGAGRDSRELLRRGWRVVAVDGERAAIDALVAATPAADRARLVTHVADIATFEIPACDLVVASVSLQFLARRDYARVFGRIADALPHGGRFAGLLYGDRDESAGDPDVTCPSPERIRRLLRGFAIESWYEREEDGHLALGDPHHVHLVEVVARRRRRAAAAPPRAGVGPL